MLASYLHITCIIIIILLLVWCHLHAQYLSYLHVQPETKINELCIGRCVLYTQCICIIIIISEPSTLINGAS